MTVPFLNWLAAIMAASGGAAMDQLLRLRFPTVMISTALSAGAEQIAQAPDGAKIAHRRRCLGEAQLRGDFLIRQLLEVPHQDALTILIVELCNRLVQAALHL